jgi:2-polyprenyl-6-methoxyphenol hydroxylase-like FAD-dependent oxidoreductase
MYQVDGAPTMPKHPQIAIIGGGPAGLTATVILHRHGHHVRVYEAEASRAHRGQGGTLDLHEDKGQVALRRAGLLEEFRAMARHEDQESKDVDPFTGAVQQGEPCEDEALDRPEMDRGVLRDLLLSALPEEAVLWDRALKSVAPSQGGGHIMTFADGQEAHADIVIGADGAWSRVRAALTDTLPFYTGVTFLEGWIEQPSQAQSDFVGHGTLFSFGGPEAIFAQRNGEGRICVYAAVKRSQEWLKTKLETVSASRLVCDIYTAWAPSLIDLLEACDDFVERPIFSLPPDVGWEPRAGLTLIGDAAHLMPPVGLGVNLAMLDASDLALALIEAADWQKAMQQAEAQIMVRAHLAMQEAVPGFMQWFGASD